MNTVSRRSFSQIVTATALAGFAPGIGPAWAQIKGLELTAPSSPGSGYDQLARTIQTVLQQEKLASGIEVKNVAGGGGTVGLAQYITGKKRGPTALIIGFALVGGVLTTKSPVSLNTLVPLARLMAEPDLIVVSSKSDIKSMADLVAKLKASPSEVRWAGGSIGGIDHVLVGLIARAVGVDASKVNFVVHAGGGEVMASVLGGHTTAALSGPEEFRSQINSGLLRPLAISSEERISGSDVPTLKEAGVDVTLMNWRGVMGHPDLPQSETKALIDMFKTMASSPSWKEALQARGWLDYYQPGPEFGPYLKEQQASVETTLKSIGMLK
jgi:putative tricarboxylic transport membrane protein